MPEQWKKQESKQEKFISVLEELSPGSYCDCFLFSEYQEQLLKLLEKIFDDKNEDISYFLYESGWLYDSEEKSFPKDETEVELYTSVESLYDYLVSRMTK